MDTDGRTAVSLNLAIGTVSDPEKNRTGYSSPVLLPVTAGNRRVMGSCDQVHSATVFNHERHTARVEKDGCVVMEGTAVLLSCTAWDRRCTTGRYYRVGLIGGAKIWADHAAALPLRALGIPFEETLTAGLVLESWTWERPVRFLPVQRDGFEVQNYSMNLVSPVKVLTFEDYHPFLHLKSLLERIFEEAGYRLSSKFMETEFFGKLHISGNYPSTNADAIRARMDFRAGRFGVAAAAADSMGRVYANPYLSFSTLGNLVETADPDEERSGSKVSGVYDNGGCFRYDGDRIAFVPLFEVVAAFEYRIYYTTDYYILTRERLAGFDTVNLDDGQLRTFELANRNADRREEFENRKTYTVIVFGHEEGNVYRLTYDELRGDTAVEAVAGQYEDRSFAVSVNSSYEVTAPKLYCRDQSGNFAAYTGDWAVYDGYVQETGTTEVELKIRSAGERLLPSTPKYFDSLFFGGAQQGMNFILGSKTTVRPLFTQYPTLGSSVTFEDIAAHGVNCLDLIKSVKHLFNLKFYTDELSKRVIAEPPDGFYADGPVIDWSRKADLPRPVIIKEPAANTAREITYCYQSGDGAVTRRNLSAGETLGKWTAVIGNRLARTGESTVENGMFTASVNRTGDYPDAPDASLLQAGDRDATLSDDLEDLNFLPKIVVYEGMRDLPGGQRWGWPSNGSAYPYLAFHHTQQDNTGTGDAGVFTLCFEDRDGIEGLHRYRDAEVAQLKSGKRIEIYMNLGPEDIEPLIRPDGYRRDFRGLFRLEIGGETALCRLEEVSGYTPSGNGPVKCVFLLEYPLTA